MADSEEFATSILRYLERLNRIGAQLPAHLGHARLIRNEDTPQNTPFSPSSVTPSLPPIQDDILS